MATDFQKEAYIANLVTNFKKSQGLAFLNGAKDLSALVDNKVLNIGDFAPDYELLDDHPGIGIPDAFQEVKKKAIPLSSIDTEAMAITTKEEKFMAGDVRKLFTQDISDRLMERLEARALYELATTNMACVFKISDHSSGGLISSMVTALVYLRKTMNGANIPQEGRMLVLSPEHEAMFLSEVGSWLVRQPLNDMKTGVLYNMYGFNIMTMNSNPYYNADKTLGSFGSVTGTQATLAFYAPRVLKAIDTPTMYFTSPDANNRWNKVSGEVFYTFKKMREDSFFALL